MISGDHFETAKSVAIKAGILNKEDLAEENEDTTDETSEKINDIEAIEFADVGLAVGSGCSKIKDVASLILFDDDFEASLKAVMWGRNIYHNVSRFI